MNATFHTAYTLHTHDAAQRDRDLAIIRRQSERPAVEKHAPAIAGLAGAVRARFVGLLGHAPLRPAR